MPKVRPRCGRCYLIWSRTGSKSPKASPGTNREAAHISRAWDDLVTLPHAADEVVLMACVVAVGVTAAAGPPRTRRSARAAQEIVAAHEVNTPGSPLDGSRRKRVLREDGLLPAGSRHCGGPRQVGRQHAETSPSSWADLLQDAAEVVLAHMPFPKEHRRRLRLTNTVERLHLEIKGRTWVIGIFPQPRVAEAHGRSSYRSRTTSGRLRSDAISRRSR